MGCGASKPSVEHCNKSQLELEQANAQQLSCPIADDSPTPPAPEVPQASEMDTGVNKRSSEVSLSSKFPSEGASNLPYRMSRGISDADSDLRNGSGMLSNDECAASDFATFSHKGYRCLYCHREGDVGVCNSSFPALVCEDCSCHNGWEQEAGQTSDNIQTKTNGSNAAEEHSNKSEGFRSSFAGTECGHSSLFYDPCERCGRCIMDTEAVYRCDACDLIYCSNCAEEFGATLHEHELSNFKRSMNNDVTDSFIVNKWRNRDGNKVINDYVVVKLLGKGSHAKVSLVQHCKERVFYALKILRRDRARKSRQGIAPRSSIVSDDDLLRETAVMKFVSHPNIVKLKEVIDDTESHKVYVIMEYCVNGPVHIHGDPPLPMEKVRRYGNNILAGLQHLHAQYLFHWDIKPANCLVDAEDVAKIADFGACGHSSRGRSFGGTPAYSCPEQFAGAHVTGDVADSWAFAMTLYQMSHGTLAYSVTCIGNLRDSLLDPTPLPIRKDLEPELHDLLSQMLDKDVSKRLMLNEAVQHPYFAESLGQPPTSESPNELCGASIEDLYARAQEAVLRGKRVGQYFHGVPSIRRMRQMMVRDIATCEAEDMDDTLVDGFELTSMESNPRFVANPADEEEVREIVNSFLQDSTREMVRIEDIFMPSMHPFIADTAASLVKLCLTNNRLFTMEGVDFSKFQHLRTLYVTKNALKFFPVEVIAAPQLTYLDLSYNSIVDVPTALSEARMLRTLCLNHNQIRHVGGDENGMSVFSGPSMQKVLLSANPLAHLPAEIVTCPAVELTVDDAPSLLEEWYTMVNCTTYVNIRWNDIYPCRVYPEVPLFVASKSVKLYNLTMLEALDVRNVVLLQFKSWIPVGEVEAGDMEMHLQALQRGVAKSVANDGNSISQMRSTRRTVVCNGEMFPVPQIFSKSVTRFLHSYFVMDEEPADQASVYNALRNYLTTRLSRKESVVVFVDERKASQMTRDTIVAVLCEVLTEAMGSEVTLGCCLNDVVDAIRGIYV